MGAGPGLDEPSSRELLDEVERMAKVGGWAFDPATSRCTWTAEVARIHEIPQGEPLSLADWLAHYEPASRELARLSIRDALDHAMPYDLELDLITAKGAHKRVRTICRPILRDGRVVSLRGTLQDITDLHRAHEARRRGDDLLRLFVENAPGAVAMFDREMRYLAHSKRFTIDLSVPDADVRGRCHYDLFPDLPNAWREVHRRCLAGATERAEADPFPRADGSTEWITWEIQPWFEAGGAIGGIVLFSEVVTERILAARALHENEERLRAMFEDAPVAMFECDLPSGRLRRVNAKMCELAGRSAADLRSMSWADLAITDDPREILESLAADRGSRTYEHRYLRDGQRRWGRTTISWFDDGRRAPTAIGVVEDVTERRAGEELAHLQTSALQAAANGIVITGNDGRVEWVNQAFTAMTGYTAADILGKTLGVLRSGLQDRKFYDELWRTIRAGEVWRGELVNRRADGTHYHEEQTITPVRDSRGEITHFVAIKTDVTERRRAENALRDSVDMLNTALDGLPTPVALATTDGRCVFINRAYRETLGYTLEDVPTIERAMELFYPDAELRARLRAQWVEDQLEARHTGMATTPRTAPVMCKDGRVRDVNFVTRPLAGFILAAFDDVTEERRSAAALADAEERQRLALDVADLATWRYDFASGTADLDPRAQALLALPPHAAFADLAARILPGEPVSREDFTRGASPGVAREVRRILMPDGEERWIEMQSKAIFEDGVPRLATVVAHDISEERHAVEALRASEERYRSLVDNLDDVIFSLDEAGRITFVSAAVRSFGYTVEQCLGRAFVDFVHPDEREQALERNKSRLSGELAGAVEYRLQDAGGKTRHVRITTRPAAGGLAGIVVDLTKVRETEAQLRAAQKMEAVGRLAGGIAHDFNNLLTVILSCADFCSTELPATSPQRSDIAEIIQAANRATSLTRQLLAFSRRQVLQPQPVDVDALVASLGKMLKRLIGEDIELLLPPSTGPCVTLVDRGQMEQVVMNLVVNARDAMPDGGRLAIDYDTVALDPTEARALDVEPGRYVRLSVADTGTGMDAATCARIFEPFFTTKAPGTGTGLGLSTVYGIVKQSRGGISVDSTLGAGSTFAIYLPALDELAPAERPPVRRAAGGREMILVVEDEAPLRAVVVRSLSRAGYQVLVAARPSEAIELASAHGSSIALVFTDVVMPEMNGRELAGRLGPLCPNARILYTSGYTDDALVRSGVLGEDFLPKPFDPATLAGRIRNRLDASH